MITKATTSKEDIVPEAKKTWIDKFYEWLYGSYANNELHGGELDVYINGVKYTGDYGSTVDIKVTDGRTTIHKVFVRKV